jgi:hypothetical protein
LEKRTFDDHWLTFEVGVQHEGLSINSRIVMWRKGRIVGLAFE